MTTDIKLSQFCLVKIIQSGRYLCTKSVNLGRKVLLDLAVPLAKGVLPKLANKAISSTISKLEREINGKVLQEHEKIDFIHFK